MLYLSRVRSLSFWISFILNYNPFFRYSVNASNSSTESSNTWIYYYKCAYFSPKKHLNEITSWLLWDPWIMHSGQTKVSWHSLQIYISSYSEWDLQFDDEIFLNISLFFSRITTVSCSGMILWWDLLFFEGIYWYFLRDTFAEKELCFSFIFISYCTIYRSRYVNCWQI